MAERDETGASPARITAIDAARGVALIAMAIYHFTWDLQFFGYLEPGTATTGGWKLFARCIASSFLFLVGVGLVLAHGRGIRWPGFGRRLVQIVAASVAITAGTWFFTPQSYVFFGILHHIAVASVIGLAFVALPGWLTLTAAVAAFLAGRYVSIEALDVPYLWWTGLTGTRPVSNDFVPLFPWISAVLAGIGAWKLAQAASLDARLAGLGCNGPVGWGLRFLGRHSLTFYLVHQPVLIGLVAGFAWLAPPDLTAMRDDSFTAQCEADCALSSDTAFCSAYCGCFLEGLHDSGRFDELFDDPEALGAGTLLADLADMCAARALEEDDGQ